MLHLNSNTTELSQILADLGTKPIKSYASFNEFAISIIPNYRVVLVTPNKNIIHKFKNYKQCKKYFFKQIKKYS